MSVFVKTFLGTGNCLHERAGVVVIPAPLEMTTSYQKGTGKGPFEIINASSNLEEYDLETKSVPCAVGIHTRSALDFRGLNLPASLEVIENSVAQELDSHHFPVVIGGEHSISIGVFRAIHGIFGEAGVVHFDAHADLRDSYEGEPNSHACVLRRLRDLSSKTLSVGVRSLSEEEARYVDREKPGLIYAEDFLNEELAVHDFENHLKSLPEAVFVTFDVDVFDLSFLPHTGTPEPGGLSWYQCLRLLRIVFETKVVVGIDVVEFMPAGDFSCSAFMISKLIYKMIAYHRSFGHGAFRSIISAIATE